MALIFIASALLAILLIFISRKKGKMFFFTLSFFVIQSLFCLYLYLDPPTSEESVFLSFFRHDKLSMIFFAVTSFAALLTTVASYYLVDNDKIGRLKFYYSALILLDISISAVFFSCNLIVNWIFLEISTIAVAAISYFRRDYKSVEATWKYIFVSSVGIAIAYMGILILSHEASLLNIGMSYDELSGGVKAFSPVMAKVAIVLIFTGYSSKLEVVPLYPASIDVNHSSPAPASGFISSGLVGASFISVFRVYRLFAQNAEIVSWMSNLFLFSGILSVLMAAVYMGRTDNFKRLLSYSTAENSAIALLGLAAGGVGVVFSILHILANMFFKTIAFIQTGIMCRGYGSYKVGHQYGYFSVDQTGTVVMIITVLSILAFPPSILFKTELAIITSLITTGKWWIALVLAISLLAIVYWMLEKYLPVFYRKKTSSMLEFTQFVPKTWLQIVLLVLLVVFIMSVWIFSGEIFSYFSL